jgi:hypothetical protein
MLRYIIFTFTSTVRRNSHCDAGTYIHIRQQAANHPSPSIARNRAFITCSGILSSHLRLLSVAVHTAMRSLTPTYGSKPQLWPSVATPTQSIKAAEDRPHSLNPCAGGVYWCRSQAQGQVNLITKHSFIFARIR